jgi:phage shock protein PspC (stress-responsive transcriptional regulator)
MELNWFDLGVGFAVAFVVTFIIAWFFMPPHA